MSGVGQAIQRAIRYIEENLLEPLELEVIAKEASYSPYHFSRIFKQHTGENVMDMVKRLRLQQGTRELLHQETKITQIGIDMGYEAATSFNKSFKKTFGCSPSEYRKRVANELERHRQNLTRTPEVIRLKAPIEVISSRGYGKYEEAASASWTTLFSTVMGQTMGQFDLSNRRFFGLCYDNPHITDSDKVRFEASISLGETTLAPNDALFMQAIPEGVYARLYHKGSYEALYDVWFQFYAWIEKEQYKLAHYPPFIENLAPPRSGEREVELYLYIPIED